LEAAESTERLRRAGRPRPPRWDHLDACASQLGRAGAQVGGNSRADRNDGIRRRQAGPLAREVRPHIWDHRQRERPEHPPRGRMHLVIMAAEHSGQSAEEVRE
jgi:hypothetical protein